MKVMDPSKRTFENIWYEIQKMREECGFSGESPFARCLLLGEEVGELFKAVRKNEHMSAASDSDVHSIKEELADVLILSFSIAGLYKIDLFNAILDKIEINKERKWKKNEDL
jgi:NTP pyrophosphatase (non-canonical NTP hydrolase)